MEVMLDLETLSTQPTALVLSIGACSFDLLTGEIFDQFYLPLDIGKQLDSHLHVSDSTLNWWMQQSEEAKAIFKVKPLDPMEVLTKFSEWYPKDENTRLWANGPAFDPPILENLYHVFAPLMAVPWNFRNIRCYRTVEEMAEEAVILENSIQHHALHDAVHQARQLVEFFKVL